MNTRHARLVLTILRERSFTAAAKALHITQPTLSQTVRQIEAQLGEPIFVRSHTTVRLTPAGELYVQAARKFIQTETQLHEAISILHGRAEGMLRLGIELHRSGELLPQIVGDFFSAYPGIRLDVREGETQPLERMLLDGELDMALLFSENHHTGLEYRQIASEEIVLLAGKRTALARRIPSGSTIGLREAEKERFILSAENSPHRGHIEELIDSCSFKPDIAVICENIESAKRICAGADLVMLCPFISLLCDSASMQKLAHYHLGTDAYLPPFYLVHTKEQSLAPYAELLFTLLSNRFRAMTAYRF